MRQSVVKRILSFHCRGAYSFKSKRLNSNKAKLSNSAHNGFIYLYIIYTAIDDEN